MTKSTVRFFLGITLVMFGCDQRQDVGHSGDMVSDPMTNTDAATGSVSGKRVFITSATYAGDLGGGGVMDPLGLGDARCNSAAKAANLGGTWKVWLSDGPTDAIDRIDDVGPWHMLDPNHTVVFTNKANLMTIPSTPIVYDERGQTRSEVYLVWTGTDTGGGSSADRCQDWYSTNSFEHGTTGSTDSAGDWTHSSLFHTASCLHAQHLYCFEQ